VVAAAIAMVAAAIVVTRIHRLTCRILISAQIL